jgi:hypothetical protein
MVMFNVFSKLNKKRKQDCVLLTEDGRILELSLSVDRGYMADHKTEEAWELFPDCCIPKRGTNRLSLVITERDMAPMSLNGKEEEGGEEAEKKRAKRAEEQLTQIAQESAAEARGGLQKKTLKSKTAETLQLLAIIFGITVCVLVLASLFMSGKLGFGGGGGESIFSWSPVISGLYAPF